MSAQVVSQVGTQMNNAAAAWALYRLTHSALTLGLQGLCFSVPIAVVPLFTGALADRFDRLLLVRLTLAAEAAQAFALAGLFATGEVRPWLLYLAAALDACRLAVNIPAQSALVPNIVPADQLLRALALSGATWSSSALVGPAAAGALLVVAGPGVVFALNGACTVVALGVVSTLDVPSSLARGDVSTVGSGLMGGVRYLVRHGSALWLVCVMVIAMAAALGVETLLPVFATITWHDGPLGYGLLRIAPGVAAVGAGLSIGLRGRNPGQPRAVVLAVLFVVTGVCLVAFAVGPPLAVAFVLLAGGSLCLTAAQVLAATRVQQAVPDALRGRVNAVISMGQNGLAGLAAVAIAGLATHVGAGDAVVGLACVAAGVGLVLCWLVPRDAGPGAGAAGGLRPR